MAARLFLLLVLALGPASAAAADPACTNAPDLLEPAAPLPALRRALRAGQVRILVVGSASVLGPGTSGPGAGWPERLPAALVASHPGLQATVAVRGGRGLTATDQAGVVAAELHQAPFDLVVWQTGTVEAARGLEVEEMASALRMGLEPVLAAHADAVLMDHQFSRFMRANADIGPYRAALQLLATAHDLPLFPRYELMRGWAEAGEVDMERAPRDRRAAAADKLNACLADAMARFLLRAAQP